MGEVRDLRNDPWTGRGRLGVAHEFGTDASSFSLRSVHIGPCFICGIGTNDPGLAERRAKDHDLEQISQLTTALQARLQRGTYRIRRSILYTASMVCLRQETQRSPSVVMM